MKQQHKQRNMDLRERKGKNDMAKKKDTKTVEIEKTETIVKYQFSQDELVKIGEQVAGLSEQLAVLDAEAKQIAKQYKSDIEAGEIKQNRLIRFIRDKHKMRSMEVFRVIDPDIRKVYFFRCDEYEADMLSGMTPENLRKAVLMDEIIPAKERDMRPSELQRELPGLSVETKENIEGGEAVKAE
jgi:hypothetical protein